MLRSHRALLTLLVGGCVDTHSSADTIRASVASAGRGAMPSAVVAASSLSRVPAEDSVVVRARATLAAARPGFHEWPSNAYAPVLSDSAAPSTTTGPLVGDFDGDGLPDVVFDGHDGRIMVTPAVLSSRGHPAIVSVEEGFDVPDPPVLRRVRFVVAPYTLERKRGLGVGFVSYDASGRAMVPVTIRIYVDGRFTELIHGN